MLLDKLWDDLGNILQVTVHNYGGAAADVVEGSGDGRLVAKIAGERDGDQAGILHGGLFEDGASAVGAPVIDDNNFVRPARECDQDIVEALQEFRQNRFFVVDGNGYREPKRFGHRIHRTLQAGKSPNAFPRARRAAALRLSAILVPLSRLADTKPRKILSFSTSTVNGREDSAVSARRLDVKNLWICVATVCVAMIAAWPVADLPFGDDTAYAHVAVNLAQHGRFAYDGWETNVLFFHACWGALFIKLFGFSFNCLRLSTMPLALGAVAFCYLLVRRMGLQPVWALFVTLLFGLSPVFLPMAVSYMTDAPALFFMFAGLYLLCRAAEAATHGKGYRWLAAGALLGFIGGTGRQVVFLVSLATLPYLAWARRKQARFAITALVTWLFFFGGVVGVMSWFNAQPYGIRQPSAWSEFKVAVSRPLWSANITARLLLMLLLLCLPAALPLAARTLAHLLHSSWPRRLLVLSLFTALIAALFIHPSLASIPWVASTLNREGISGDAPLAGRPVVLTTPVRAVAGILVYAVALVLLGLMADIRNLTRRALGTLRDVSSDAFALNAMAIFSAVYFALVIVRASEFDVFDRYLLPMLPCVATVLLLVSRIGEHDELIARRAIPFAWAFLIVLAGYAVASTQDWWALSRARSSAAARLESAGIPRTAIDAGFEYNAWTELMRTGHLNSRWVTNPPEAYNPALSVTPTVSALYKLEYKPSEGTTASDFSSVPFFSLLPPFHKQVAIDRVLGRPAGP